MNPAVETLLNSGEALFQQGKIDQAITAFQQALALDADCAEACNNLGVVFSHQGDNLNARQYFQKAIQISPNYRDAVLNYAEVLLSLQEISLAKSICENYLMQNQLDGEIKSLLSRIVSAAVKNSGNSTESKSELKPQLPAFSVRRHHLDLPAISLIIVTNNDSTSLKQTIDSVLKQSYPNWECILITGSLINATNYDNDNIKQLYQPNSDKFSALNAGIQAVNNEIIGFAEPGDILEIDTLKNVSDFFHRYPSRGILQIYALVTLNTGGPIAEKIPRKWRQDELAEFWKFGALPLMQSIFFRRELLDMTGSFNPALGDAALYDLLLKLTNKRLIFALNKIGVNIPLNSVTKLETSVTMLEGSPWSKIHQRYKSAARPESPKITVIIPCYNYGKYLPDSVGSICKQTYRDFEIIIVNDGSSDNTIEVAEKLVASYPQVPIIQHNQANSGQPAISRNRGIALSSGEYIMALDGDDMVDPRYLEAAVTILDNMPGIALVYPDQTHIWPDQVKIIQSSEWDIVKFREGNLLPHCAVFRRFLWEEIGGFQTNVIGYEDWDFWIGIAEKGYHGKRIPYPFFYYRRHPGSVFATTGERDKRLRAQTALNHPLLFGKSKVEDAKKYFASLPPETAPEHIKNINKTMDYDDLLSPEAQPIIRDLNDLIVQMKQQGLKISSWYGHFHLDLQPDTSEKINRGFTYKPLPGAADDVNFPWFLYWELVWVILNADFKPGQKVMDLGGSSSLFSYYLASKGLDVTTVDLQQSLVDNANITARKTGWKLQNYAVDMRRLNFTEKFDHIVSICVYEHIPMYDRVEINSRIKDLLLPGGRFSITFDYRNPSKFTRFNSPQEVSEQFVRPSGLKIRGNQTFFDNGKNYLFHPFYYPGDFSPFKEEQVRLGHFDRSELGKVKRENDYTFAALFLENT